MGQGKEAEVRQGRGREMWGKGRRQRVAKEEEGREVWGWARGVEG